MRYQVIGDRGFGTQCLLSESDNQTSLRHWFDRYTASGDLGGYDTVELGRYDTVDGDFVVIQSAETLEGFLFDEY